MGNKLSFRFKLMVSYIILIMTPVIIIGTFSYHSSVESAKRQSRQNIQGTLLQMKDNVMYRIKDVGRVSDQLYMDQQLQGNLSIEEDAWSSYETLTKHLKPTFQNAIDLSTLHINMQVYIKNRAIPEYYFTAEDEDPLALGKRYNLYQLDRLESEAWYEPWKVSTIYGANQEVKWLQVAEDKQYGNISLLRNLNDYAKINQIGFIRITAKLSEIFDAIDYMKIGDHATLVVYDRANRPLFSSGDKNTALLEQGADSDKSDYLRIDEPLDGGLNWRIVAYIPTQLLAANADSVRQITVLVCLISFLVLTAVSVMVSRVFSIRITKIIASLNAIRGGDFRKRISYKGNDEFAQIAAAFNDMGKDIDELIREVYLSNLKKKEAELTLLQEQINPHFLYNTLSSISRLARFGEIERLHQMVMGLAKFYRLSLNEGKTIISVDREIQQIQTYIDIQKIKFADGLDVTTEIDPDVLPYSTVKMILQPFVENALQHAWNGDHIHIHIHAYKDNDRIVFTISDDGVGMLKEMIDCVLNREIKGGYGIRNVDDRIKLQCGSAYGVQIQSVLGEGTSIHIEIPCFYDQDGDMAVVRAG
ncbi:sensor histidine kinase [Paenibacillus sp. CF384]|uniref:sensor histidine kinase n=1 Tax=Paenibacillus sp. CF384 TaxID=1884382 RepID=UPI00089AFA3D|nr:sensor histidine kinase [Paenibacillus sp. CF384]SDX46344.1 Sensor histidine kinase YesM [Paenibacillus sp. CF384]